MRDYTGTHLHRLKTPVHLLSLAKYLRKQTRPRYHEISIIHIQITGFGFGCARLVYLFRKALHTEILNVPANPACLDVVQRGPLTVHR